MSKKIALYGAGLATTIGSLMLGATCFAAADQDVIDAATTTASTMKENLTGAIIPSLPYLIAAGILVLAIVVVWRLGKSFVRGR